MRTIAKSIPLGRLGTADDVIGAGVFLASDEASYITGVNLAIQEAGQRCSQGRLHEQASRVVHQPSAARLGHRAPAA